MLHFAHGNGFPALCYSQLLKALQTRYQCTYIDRIGHNPEFPVTENWHCLVNELIHTIQQQNFLRESTAPIIAVGHSLGGVLTFLAAHEKPELFKVVVMIDAPILNQLKSRVVRLAKSLGVIDNITPARAARRRRQYWQSQETLYQYLKEKPLFRTFTEACLQDFMRFGVEQTKEGYQLRFDPQIEYLIFRTLPHHLPYYIKQLSVPVILMYGDQSTVVSRLDVQYMQQRYNIHCIKMKGTHMLPMESPELLAKMIFQAIDNIE
ncbi:MAG: hydrolase [Legionellales bacterium RIFCSPHIGHO2_12_FULL_42_9]|nr:MAG: hydrolase [Legionellales bacterium RIFCSPHIGHO2_12_FULL_42_9]